MKVAIETNQDIQDPEHAQRGVLSASLNGNAALAVALSLPAGDQRDGYVDGRLQVACMQRLCDLPGELAHIVLTSRYLKEIFPHHPGRKEGGRKAARHRAWRSTTPHHLRKADANGDAVSGCGLHKVHGQA